MYLLYVLTALALAVSFVFSREKTVKALKISVKKFINILPAFLLMIIIVSVILYLIPESLITAYLTGKSRYAALLFASFFGSVTLLPGFIAFPLCGILLKKGVSYMILAAFSTSLMMVGVLTFPVEKEYFGAKVTFLRNFISLIIALMTAFAIGIYFGEL